MCKQDAGTAEYRSRSGVQQQLFNVSDTDADVGPWQPDVVAVAADTSQSQAAASATAIEVPAHVRNRLMAALRRSALP